MKVVLSKERVLNYIKKYYSEVLGINGYAVFESNNGRTHKILSIF